MAAAPQNGPRIRGYVCSACTARTRRLTTTIEPTDGAGRTVVKWRCPDCGNTERGDWP